LSTTISLGAGRPARGCLFLLDKLKAPEANLAIGLYLTSLCAQNLRDILVLINFFRKMC
jgi:hypothetical protein